GLAKPVYAYRLGWFLSRCCWHPRSPCALTTRRRRIRRNHLLRRSPLPIRRVRDLTLIATQEPIHLARLEDRPRPTRPQGQSRPIGPGDQTQLTQPTRLQDQSQPTGSGDQTRPTRPWKQGKREGKEGTKRQILQCQIPQASRP